jgi:hypothetical protein
VCILGGGFGGLYTAIKLELLMWPKGKKPQVDAWMLEATATAVGWLVDTHRAYLHNSKQGRLRRCTFSSHVHATDTEQSSRADTPAVVSPPAAHVWLGYFHAHTYFPATP